jgi:tRNA modification GTPase
MSAVILAVASPPGTSLRGIVRISGAQTFELLSGCLELRRRVCGPDLREACPSRGVHRTRLRLNGLDLPCLALVFPAPGSYTGEDAVELQLPGNPPLLERVIDALTESGRARGLDARRAEAGEFTARAFLNGEMSLTQAEGVSAIIAARSDAQLRAGRLLTSGALGALAGGLADELAGALALVEAGIDFTDQEDVVAIGPRELYRRLVSLRERIQEQLDRSVGSEQLEALAWVVLTGGPNTGKSTLFNALLGRTRAVVSEVAGTTRDVLTEPLSIDTPHGPAEVMLVDLAGADSGESTINRKMQAAAQQAIERADLVLHCVPVDETAPDVANGDRLMVRTKSDLDPTPDAGHGIAVSAFTGDGLETLKAAVTRRLAHRAVSLAADAMALRPRHEAALRSAQGNLTEAIALVEPSRDERHLPRPEIVAAALRTGLNDLGRLAGDVTPDDVLGRIFSTFCVGK